MINENICNHENKALEKDLPQSPERTLGKAVRRGSLQLPTAYNKEDKDGKVVDETIFSKAKRRLSLTTTRISSEEKKETEEKPEKIVDEVEEARLDAELFLLKKNIRESGCVTNVAAKQYINSSREASLKHQRKKSDETSSLESSNNNSKKGINFMFWKKRNNEKENESDNEEDPIFKKNGTFLSQAMEKVARSSETPLRRSNSSKQRLLLARIGSMKWQNMSARWGKSSSSMGTSKRGDLKRGSSEWMLKEEAIR